MNMKKTFLVLAVMCAGAMGFESQAKNVSLTDKIDNNETTAPQNNRNRNETEPECENLYGKDSLKTRQQTSLYRDEFRRGNYMASLPFWRYVYKNAPCFKEYITADGAYLMSLLIGQTDPKDTATINKYADTLIQIYDTRLRLFGENTNVLGRKGSDLFRYFPSKRMEAIELMKKSLKGEGNNTYAPVLTDLILAATQQNRADKKITDDEILQLFDEIMGVVDYNLGAYRKQYKAAQGDTATIGQNMRYWEWVENYVVAVVTPYLTCEKLTEIYTPKFEATPNDKKLIEKIIALLDRSQGCAKTDFYLKVAEKNLELNPDAGAAAALAKAYHEKKQLSKAKGFYEKAAELEEDNSKKEGYYLTLASIELSSRSCQQARAYARKALELNPNSGEAYIIIGNAYMQCTSGCGTTNVSKKYPYLAAYDKFQKAKSVDPSVAAKANKGMATAKGLWPKREDAFFENLNDGITVNTGCWIGESTILRTIK